MKLWQKKYQLNSQIEKFTVGTDYLTDQKLVTYDCIASIAHAKMLHKIGILTKIECDKLIEVLQEIIALNGQGKFIVTLEDEDCHTAIENFLVNKLGDIGKKIHTARSRNDQILTALRLYYKEEIQSILQAIDELTYTLLLLNGKYGQMEIPGYTHMQKAMPSSVELWANSFVDSMDDNKILLVGINELVDQSPAGTGAGYGVPIDVDRVMIASLLGFKKIQNNSLYVQNSRGKFESSLLHAFTQIMIDLNKMASDLLLFSMSEVGYVTLPAELCTGSSMMPHKKNPDVLELIRAHYHQMVSWEFQIKNISGNLISGYNRDMQLTKDPIIKGFELTKESLKIMKLVMENIHFNEERCKNAMTKDLYITKKAYELVNKGIPFREAYAQVAQQLDS